MQLSKIKSWLFGLVGADAELTGEGRKLTWFLVWLYVLATIYMCWTPQPPSLEGVETPDIQYYGRLVVLWTPFNSILNFGQLDSLKEIFWVVAQNVVNVFLLFPLIMGLLALFPKMRSWRKAVLISLGISLIIECGQLLLDLLINANRVFEIDDLWTNTLGGLLAYWFYGFLVKMIKKRKSLR
ncbi:VanZ family protein [Streptococcus dentiloxodontae]